MFSLRLDPVGFIARPAGLDRLGGPIPLRLVLARVLALRAEPASAANEPQAGPPPEPQRAA